MVLKYLTAGRNNGTSHINQYGQCCQSNQYGQCSIPTPKIKKPHFRAVFLCALPLQIFSYSQVILRLFIGDSAMFMPHTAICILITHSSSLITHRSQLNKSPNYSQKHRFPFQLGYFYLKLPNFIAISCTIKKKSLTSQAVYCAHTHTRSALEGTNTSANKLLTIQKKLM